MSENIPSRHEARAVNRIAEMLGAALAGILIVAVLASFMDSPAWLLLSGMGLILFLFLGLSAREVVIFIRAEEADELDEEGSL